MPNPAAMNVGTGVTNSSGGTAGSAANGRGQSVGGVVPFVRASQLHREGAFYDQTTTLVAGSKDLGSIDVPAYGYLRSILIKVTATGDGTGGAFAGDAPFSVIQNLYLSEPNGATIVQLSSGYNLYLANKWGGYQYAGDPKNDPFYATTAASGTFTFFLRVPVEIDTRDALGSLPNQNAASSYKIRLSLDGGDSLYATAPSAFPDVRVQMFLEAWDQPEPSTNGQTNQTTPPAMNTTQFLSEQILNVSPGQQTLRHTRMGNYIRNWIYVYRENGARTSTNWPSPTTLYWDTRPLDQLDPDVWRLQMKNRTGYTGAADAANGLDTGVFVYDFCHEFDGKIGMENRDLWLPTLSSTRWEVQGNFGGLTGGTLTIITNDVSVAGNVFL